ncbi:MAG: tRNA uracil 4-sulfurtransferase ThiI [Bradymonadaceae bacterium]
MKIRDDNPVGKRTVIILRLSGELSTKSNQTRKRFHRQLKINIRDALDREGISYELKSHWYRMDVETDDDRAVDVLRRIFGLQALSATQACLWATMDDVVERSVSLNSERVRGKTFAVRARRAGHRDEMPFTSLDLNRAIGERLVAAGGTVQLREPEIEVHLEVRRDDAFYSEEEISCYGGLPTGVEGRALALMSGGFDSAISSWLMLGRGVELDFVFFDLGGPPHQRAVKKVTRALAERWIYGYAPKIHIVDFRPILAQMRENVKGRFWQLLLKRLMVRATHLIAEREGALAMITGESLGQVSSQTLVNLTAITHGVPTPVLRPLLGMNKDRIIELSREIGTYDICAGVPEFCALDGGKPVIKARVQDLDRYEEKLDPAVLQFLVDHGQKLDVLSMDVDEDPKVEVDHVPKGAVVVDLRNRAAFEGWSYPDAVHLEFEKALDNFFLLPKNRAYLFYCDVGLKSAFLAETMVHQGFEALSLKGGLVKLKRLARKLEKA